jgi:hypothetical protein
VRLTSKLRHARGRGFFLEALHAHLTAARSEDLPDEEEEERDEGGGSASHARQVVGGPRAFKAQQTVCRKVVLRTGSFPS